ncbi:unnamed protein product [Clonostachys rosea f. rosea IK726]|uniref:SGNH hydrolase-type esterase domain-containing protein n=2 Tax=Bionectria ochroleuca TaxID=29856 RepID=A0A0B7JPK2_BIOOC|nr:unnamed protein product [Clonostachys rosea f. rosea IK726]
MHFLSILSAGIALATLGSAKDTRYLFTFGDSYSRTGFDIKGDKPTTKNPLGNPAMPGKTSSGGKNWIGYVLEEKNKDHDTLSWNFASGGATVDKSIIVGSKSNVQSFTEQVKSFQDTVGKKPDYAKWDGDSAAVGVWMGLNDLGTSYYRKNSTKVIEKSVDKYFEELESLYKTGIRKFFLLQVPPTYRTPLIQKKGRSKARKLQKATKAYNKRLNDKLNKFKKSHKDVKAALVKTEASFKKALDTPKSVGAKNNKCTNKDGKSCLWRDTYHPGTGIHKLVAAKVTKALKDIKFW